MTRWRLVIAVSVTSIVVALHTAFVNSIARIVLKTTLIGEPGYDMWWPLIVIDYPVFFVKSLVTNPAQYHVGDNHFWAYTVNYQVFLWGGGFQWAVMTLVSALIWSRMRKRRQQEQTKGAFLPAQKLSPKAAGMETADQREEP